MLTIGQQWGTCDHGHRREPSPLHRRARTSPRPCTGSFWLFVSAWQCDESCAYPDARGRYPADATWHQIPGAWEWTALGAMGALGFLLAVGFAIALVARRRTLARALAVAGIVVAIAPWMVA